MGTVPHGHACPCPKCKAEFPSKQSSQLTDSELQAMQSILNVLRPLDKGTQVRLLAAAVIMCGK